MRPTAGYLEAVGVEYLSSVAVAGSPFSISVE